MVDFTRNYVGRAVDAYIMDLPEPPFEGQAGLRFQSNVKVATGIQKLAQLYTILLFTATGSKLLVPTDGTALGDLVLGGVTPLREQIRFQVNIGNLEAKSMILEDQEDLIDQGIEDIPDDELLDTSQVVGLEIPDRSTVIVTVLLTTVAGDSRLFTVPLPLVP